MSELKKKLFVLGLDGVPYSLLTKLCKRKNLPNISNIIMKSEIKEIKSVYPVISSVAWTSFATGVNPAEHGIFGFIDRNKSPFHITIPTSRERRADTIWKTLSAQNKKTVVINVPITYPVEPVNGKMVSCFLCPDIEKGAYPKELVPILKKNNYIIDADAWLARTDRRSFLDQIFEALDARFKVAFEFMDDNWDYFQLHIMETDRLMHFFWYDIENQESIFYKEIQCFFIRLDMWIGKLFEKLHENDSVVILSDHGFCGIKHEVQMNTWLKEKGYLVMNENLYNLDDYNEKTMCYSLLPGRFYVNLKGREEKGSVAMADYDKIREQIKKDLLDLKDPENGKYVIHEVFFKEEIYQGDYLGDAADVIAYPNNGYDLKGMLHNEEIFTNSALTGMHTYEDAVIIGVNFPVEKITTIEDVRQEILKVYGIM